ncbi:MAG: xanthan lyase, partial [Prevotella sp.]
MLPKPYNKYRIKIITNGCTIEELIPDFKYKEAEVPDMWEGIEYTGNPWVCNVSRPNAITHGLYNKHISLWASHGMFYDQKKAQWRWQRPNLFGTTEDLFTQTIIVPYLIPMLENAGANVFTPRERDYQTEEIIIDNDNQKQPFYTEFNESHKWMTCPGKGFAYHSGTYSNGENPFNAGTARMAKTTSKKKSVSAVAYQPTFPTSAAYAVYVSYPSTSGNISDAEYIVYHKGQETTFKVNQTMGNDTWVYLGTFEFDKGCNMYNRVVITNHSSEKGFVTTDAVRFGGGMGNIQRGGITSTMPRCLEGARYSAQWYGAPSTVYNGKNGTDDYSDDINVRSLMTNWLGGGSIFMPSLQGKNVPIELSLAIHSDAGYSSYSDSIIGSLSICTTKFNDGKLNCGISRLMSKDFALSLQSNIGRDLRSTYKRWTCRGLYDKNYSETRLPEVPSAIIETLSHQNYGDLRLGHDPNFKFTMARAI